MDYNDLIVGMKRFGAADKDVCVNSLGIASNMIRDNVVITPSWEPQKVSGLGKAELLVSSAPLCKRIIFISSVGAFDRK